MDRTNDGHFFNNEPTIDDIQEIYDRRRDVLIIRKAFADTFQIWPFSITWRQANWYDVQMFPDYAQPKDQRYYTYLMIDGKAVRQN